MNNLKSLTEGGAPGGIFPKTETNAFDYAFRELGAERFYNDYWEKKPLYIESDDPGYYTTLLGAMNLDELLCNRFLHEGDIRVFKQESQAPYNTYSKQLPGLYGQRKVVQAAKALNLYQQGYTLIFQNVNQYSQAFASLVRSFEREAQFSARANVYVTPPNTHGFGKHWDHMCSIILQLDGEKEWQVFEREMDFPMHTLGPDQGKGKTSELMFTKTLKPGDLLYVPRGFAHAPQTNDTHSVHVNIAFKPIYTAELLDVFVHDLVASHPQLRQGVHPLGSAPGEMISDAIASMLTEYDWHTALQKVRQETLQDRPPMYQQWWRQEEAMDSLTPETAFHFNTKMEWSYTTSTDRIAVVTNGKRFFVNREAEPILNFIASCDGNFCWGDIPSSDDALPRTVVSELVKSGVIFIK